MGVGERVEATVNSNLTSLLLQEVDKTKERVEDIAGFLLEVTLTIYQHSNSHLFALRCYLSQEAPFFAFFHYDR